MSILRRSFIYIFRKKSRTVLIFMILFLISTAILSSITIRKSAHNARESINASINASFELKTNLQTNMGVGDRGFGNISQMMIEKISKHEGIRDFNASIFGEAQLPQLKKVQLEESRIKYQDDQEALLKSHFDLEGTRKSELDSKFVSEVLELHEGRHLNEDDFQKVMVHHDFATLNGLKLHDVITIPESKDRNQNIIKSQKLEIIGIFKGSNKDRANHFSELFENVMLSDLNTAATLRGMEHKPLYESATFYVNNPKKIESIISDVKNMDLDWVRYVVHKADQTFMGLTSSLDNMDGIINKLVTGSIIMSILMLSVVLWLWIGTRVHETGILLSMGMSKLNILSQFVLEVLIIAILSFSLSFMTTDKIARNIGSSIIKQAQTQTIRQQNQELNGMAFGSDANTSVTTKTVDSIDVSITHSELIKVAIIGSVIIIISVLGASNYIIRLKPKEILSQMS